MTLATASLNRNLSRFETALVVIVTGVLTVFFYQKVQRLDAEMERVSVDLVANQIRSQLIIFQIELTTAGKAGLLADYEGRNPFDQIYKAPLNYAGEIDDDQPDRVTPGQWYFDKKTGQLIYRVVHDHYFKSDLKGPARIRFHLSLDYLDANGNGRYDAGVDKIRGLLLRGVDHYVWSDHVNK